MAPKFDPIDVTGAFIGLPVEGGGSTEGPPKVERLLRHFEDHEYKERKTLEEYRGAIEKAQNPMVRFLLDLIRLDEEKHHEVINTMLSTLEKHVLWRHSPAALDVFQDVGAERAELLALVQKFIRLEREGIKEYEGLLSDTKGYYEGLFPLLIRALIKDSEKHLMFLEFLQKYIRTTRR